MIPLIEPVDRRLIKAELNDRTFLRRTQKAGNEIYIINPQTAPHALLELGRVRELTFRATGAGSGKDVDLDHFDLEDPACYQLMVWDPDNEEIIGAYRFTLWAKATFHPNGQPYVNTEHLFHFSDKFIRDYMPYTIEMARAFIQPQYQSVKGGVKSLYALDNIWDGIGGLVAISPDVKYLAGKVSIYSTSPEMSRKAMIFFLDKFFGDREGLLTGKGAETFTDEEKTYFNGLFNADTEKENYKILSSYVKSLDDYVPPLIHSYIELSSSMKTFGTVFDPSFGDVYDTAMIITLADVYEKKWKRYVESYKKESR